MTLFKLTVAGAAYYWRTNFAVVLGVANRVGAPARGEWKAHHEAASLAAANVVLRWIDDGAAGFNV